MQNDKTSYVTSDALISMYFKWKPKNDRQIVPLTVAKHFDVTTC